MNLRKHGLRVLGLSLLAALGLVVLTASAAHAKQGLFLINDSLANLLATFTGGLIGGTGSLLVPSLDVGILCTGLTVLAGSEIINAHEGLANLRLDGCAYYIISALPAKVKPGANCTIYNELADKTKHVGQILVSYKLLPILVKLAGGAEHKLLILAEPDLKLPSGKVVNALITSEKCNVPSSVEATGSTVLQLLAADAAKQELIEAPEALRLLTPGVEKDQLFYGTNEAFIDGEAFLELTGSHSTQTWGSE